MEADKSGHHSSRPKLQPLPAIQDGGIAFAPPHLPNAEIDKQQTRKAAAGLRVQVPTWEDGVVAGDAPVPQRRLFEIASADASPIASHNEHAANAPRYSRQAISASCDTQTTHRPNSQESPFRAQPSSHVPGRTESSERRCRKGAAVARVKLICRRINSAVRKMHWKPMSKPSEQQIVDFIQRTQGGQGSIRHSIFRLGALDSSSTTPPSRRHISPAPETGRQGSIAGSFGWIEASAEAARYLIVDTMLDGRPNLNLHLVKFYALHEWGLPRPGMILSVVGGAEEATSKFSYDEQEKVFKGMFEGTRGLTPWIVTGGLKSGMVRHVGEARAQYNPSVPLIGIVPLGLVPGYSTLKARAADRQPKVSSDLTESAKSRELPLGIGRRLLSRLTVSFRGTSMKIETTVEKLPLYDEMKSEEEAKLVNDNKLKDLDSNHTHFIFTDDGTPFSAAENFGKEAKVRAEFEACMGANIPPIKTSSNDNLIRPYQSGTLAREMEEHILRVICKTKVGWDHMNVKKPNENVSFRGIPVVSVCMQGGPETIANVLSSSANGTPVLVIKGTGTAAELLADCFLLRFAPEHQSHVDYAMMSLRQKNLVGFITKLSICTPGQVGIELLKARYLDPHKDGERKIIKNLDSEDHNCYDLSGLVHNLSQAIVCASDSRYKAHLRREMQACGSPLGEIKAWIDDYVQRASSMRRNYYGQTKKEEKQFPPLSEDKVDLVYNLCDRNGLFCHVAAMPNECAILICSKREFNSAASEARGATTPSVRSTGSPKDRDTPDSSLPRDIVVRLFSEVETDFYLEIEAQAATICKTFYNLPTENPIHVLLSAITAVVSNKLWLFDLHNQRADFKSSLLSCLLNGLGNPRADDQTTLALKLKYAIIWERPDILTDILKRTGMQDPLERVSVLREALTLALARNCVPAVQILLENGSNVDQFAIIGNSRNYVDGETSLVAHKLRRGIMKAGALRAILHSPSDTDQGRRNSLLNTTKRIKNEVMAQKAENSWLQTQREHWYRLMKLALSDEHTGYLRLIRIEIKDRMGDNKIYTNLKEQIKMLKDQIHRLDDYLKHRMQTDSNGSNFDLTEVPTDSVDLNQLLRMRKQLISLKANQYLMVYEEIFRFIIGDIFVYQLGVHGPWFDLFLWSVLMDRRDLAKVFWRRCELPLRCSITAAGLLRCLAQHSAIVDPVTSRSMIENANYFEELAVVVHMQALANDHEIAEKTLDTPLTLWKNMTMLDLVMFAQCGIFSERCCLSIIRRIQFGDIKVDGQFFIKRKIFLAVLTGGLPVLCIPNFFTWEAPPLSEMLRLSTQHRPRKKGYPYNPQNNAILARISQGYASATSFLSGDMDQKDQHISSFSFKNLGSSPSTVTQHAKARRLMQKLEMHGMDFAERMTEKQLMDLWDPTLSQWHRFQLFWRVPMVLFLTNALVMLIVALSFTAYLMGLESSRFGLQPIFESALLFYFLATLTRELMQVFLEGLKDYFSTRWNLIEMACSVVFMVGYGLRFTGAEEHQAGTNDEVTGISTPVLPWRVCYGLSLCMLWLGMLRFFVIFETLGLFVSMFFQMLFDVFNFLVLYMVIVIAFGSLMLGASNPTGVVDRCHIEERSMDYQYLYMSCLDENYWSISTFFRTWFQGWGRLVLEEMTNESSIFITILNVVVLNVVLMNMLIARLAGTYRAISEHADFQRVQELNETFKDYRRWAIALPPPVNVVFLLVECGLFVYHYREIRTRDHQHTWPWLFVNFLMRASMDGSWVDEEKDPQVEKRTSMRLKSVMARAVDSAPVHKKLQDGLEKTAATLQQVDELRSFVSQQVKHLEERLLQASYRIEHAVHQDSTRTANPI